ncbi:MAG TPA: hypothetical protein PKI11_00970 [Candidatus Hydrogenedentes bacterium]|nr:hypothetical protein [Candidatus Hydrogenedentota bacterium]
MAAHQMIDLLRFTEQFHKDLADYYERLGHEMRREDVRQALDYMAHHERCLQLCFHDYEVAAPKPVTQAWLKNPPDFQYPDGLREKRVNPEMSVEEVLGLAIRFDEALIAFYQRLAEQALPGDLRAAIDAILEMEREEEKRLVRGLQDL